MNAKINDFVKKNDVIATLYTSKENLDNVSDMYLNNITIGKKKVKEQKLILGYIK